MANVLEDLLLRSKLLDEARLQAAKADAAQRGVSLVQAIVALRLASDRAVAQLIAGAQKLRVLDPTRLQVEPEALQSLPAAVAQRLRALPLRLRNAPEGAFLHVAMSDPTDAAAIAELSALTARQVVAAVAEEGALSVALERSYPVAPLEPVLALGVLEVPVPQPAAEASPAPAYLQASPPPDESGFLSESTNETVGMYARLQAGAPAAPIPQTRVAPSPSDPFGLLDRVSGAPVAAVDDPFAALELTSAAPPPPAAAPGAGVDDPFAALELTSAAPPPPAAAPGAGVDDPFAALELPQGDNSGDLFAGLDLTTDDGAHPAFSVPDDPGGMLAAWEPAAAPDAYGDDSYDDTQDSVSLELEFAADSNAAPASSPGGVESPPPQAWADSFFRDLDPSDDGPSLQLSREPTSKPPPTPSGAGHAARGYLRSATCVVAADPATRHALRSRLEGEIADLTTVSSVHELRELCALLPLRYGVVLAPHPDEAARETLIEVASLATGPDLVLVDADAALAASVPLRAQLYTTPQDDVPGRILKALWELEAA